MGLRFYLNFIDASVLVDALFNFMRNNLSSKWFVIMYMTFTFLELVFVTNMMIN